MIDSSDSLDWDRIYKKIEKCYSMRIVYQSTQSTTFEIMSRQMPNLKSSEFSSMEINGTPYYVASKEGVPYLYDVDTREEVGYWSSKKGQYIMFSLYNKIMKKKYENLKYENFSDSSESTDDLETIQPNSDSDSDSESGSHEEKEESSGSDSESGSQEDIQIKKKYLNKMFMFTFLILFIYLTLQKEFQSIYFDFIFLIFINLLNMFKVFEVLNDEQ